MIAIFITVFSLTVCVKSIMDYFSQIVIKRLKLKKNNKLQVFLMNYVS